jgi:hypothetical protein
MDNSVHITFLGRLFPKPRGCFESLKNIVTVDIRLESYAEATEDGLCEFEVKCPNAKLAHTKDSELA